MSQIEGMLPLAAPRIIEWSATGRVGPRRGNRHATHVPHGCFRCAGPDEWVVVAVTGPQALCDTMGRPVLASDPGLATVEGRRAREDEIEVAVAGWTAGRPAREAMAAFQANGVAAGVAFTATDLLPFLTLQRFYVRTMMHSGGR